MWSGKKRVREKKHVCGGVGGRGGGVGERLEPKNKKSSQVDKGDFCLDMKGELALFLLFVAFYFWPRPGI